MSDLTTSSNSAWESVDLGALEARLNSLGSEAPPVEAEQPESISLLEQFLADESLQHLISRTETVAEDGTAQETFVQYHRVSIASNQTRFVIHLAFQPDLKGIPTVDANLMDIAGRARITHATKFGARIEMSLTNALPESATVCVEAICVCVDQDEAHA
jgi:hypothetical protein